MKKQSEEEQFNWEDPLLNDVATNIQAGYRGMKAREQMAKEEDDEIKKMEQQSRDIEDRLGISLDDPKVVEAATKIQAGFRGAQTFSQSIPSIAGFKATAIIGSWDQRRKLIPKVLTSFEKDDIATKTQAGYRGMKTREDARHKPSTIAGFRVSAHIINWAQKTKK